MKSKTLIIAALTAALAIPILAQEQERDEGPGRGVARISVINGEVSVKRGDSGELVAAAINAPLVLQDRLMTGPGSRAEVQFDSANSLRIGSSSEVRLSEMDNQRYQIQVAAGTTTFRVLRESNAQIELATPNVSVRPMGKGVYRVSVLEDGSTEITVRSGQAEIITQRGSEKVGAGQTMLARGSAQDPEFQVTAAIPLDEWDRYNETRDRDLEHSRSYNYVSPDITGAEDLDRYGRWSDVAPYGHVWVPTADPGWAPYRDGRWTWEDWYGWTWVSNDPWGWAPYHYGRWFNSGPDGWCWYPGGFGRQYWSPALVGFFGFGGGGLGFGFGFGNVGWVPLAPFEPFHRWWGPGHYGGTNINNTTIVNNTNITNIYRNARVNNGITAVNATDFGRARITNGNLIRMSQADLGRVNLVRGQLPVTPSRESLALSDRAVRTANLPRVSDNQRFFSKRQPQPVQRIPFEQQRQNIQANTRRSLGDTSGRGTGTFGGREAATSTPGVTGRGSTNGGWRRGVETQAPATANRPAESGGGQWHRFGEPSHTRDSVRSTPAQDGNGRRFGEPGNSRQMQEPAGRSSDRSPRSEPGNSRQIQEPAGRSMDRSPRSEPARPEPYRSPAPSAPRSDPPARSNDRPSRSDAGWQRFGGNNTGAQSSRAWGGQVSTPAPVRISPPIVRDRSASSYSPSRGYAPSYNAPRGGGYAPTYSAPRNAPTYSAPRGGGGYAPSYSAPRNAPSYGASRGGGGSAPSYNAPRSTPSYSAPRGGGGSSPSYSAPRGGSGGGGGSRSAAPSGGGRESDGRRR